MKIENIKTIIKEIDDILDDDSISNEMYTQLDEAARILTKVLGELENEQNFKNVKEIKKLGEYTDDFLTTFECGTTLITNRQAEIFKDINNGKPFIYKGRRYECEGPNFKVGFSHIFISEYSRYARYVHCTK